MKLTQREIIKAAGFYPLRDGMFVWSPEGFREHFKVGDIIRGYGGRVVGKITAIGDKRFLFRVTRPYRVDERVGTMTQARGWAKP